MNDATCRRTQIAQAARDMSDQIRALIEENFAVLRHAEQLIDAGEEPESLRVRIDKYRDQLERVEEFLQLYEQGRLDEETHARFARLLDLWS